MARQPLVGRGVFNCRGFRITFRRTTLGRTALDESSARRKDLYLTTHNTHNRHTSMPPAGTHNPSKWAAADSCGHRIRLFIPWAPIDFINWLGQLINNGKQHLSTLHSLPQLSVQRTPPAAVCICLHRLSCRPTHFYFPLLSRLAVFSVLIRLRTLGVKFSYWYHRSTIKYSWFN